MWHVRFTYLLALFLSCSVAHAVPFEMIFSGQVTDGSGVAVTNLNTGAPTKSVGGLRITFWSTPWIGGAAPQTPPAAQQAATLLATAGGSPLTVPNVYPTSCTPGGSFNFASCQSVSTNSEGVFQVNLHLSLADFDALFQDTETSKYIQIERVWIHIDTGAVTPLLYYPRQRFASVPYCLKVPIDTSLAYTGGRLGIAPGAITDAQIAGTISESKIPSLTSFGKVHGSAVTGAIGNGTSIDTSGNINTTGSLTVNGVSVTTGIGTAGYLSAWNGPASQGNSPVYHSNGNVGIGTTVPQHALDVAGSARIGEAPAALTTLSTGIDSTSTTVPVSNTAGYPTSGTIQIRFEAMLYTGLTANSFTGVTRGAYGTTAVPHTAGDTVDVYLLTAATNTTSLPPLTATAGGNIGIASMAYPGMRVRIEGSGTTAATGTLQVVTGSRSLALSVTDDAMVHVGRQMDATGSISFGNSVGLYYTSANGTTTCTAACAADDNNTIHGFAANSGRCLAAWTSNKATSACGTSLSFPMCLCAGAR